MVTPERSSHRLTSSRNATGDVGGTWIDALAPPEQVAGEQAVRRGAQQPLLDPAGFLHRPRALAGQPRHFRQRLCVPVGGVLAEPDPRPHIRAQQRLPGSAGGPGGTPARRAGRARDTTGTRRTPRTWPAWRGPAG